MQNNEEFKNVLAEELEKRFKEQRKTGIYIGYIAAYLGVAKYLKTHTKKDAIEYFSKQAKEISEKTGLNIDG